METKHLERQMKSHMGDLYRTSYENFDQQWSQILWNETAAHETLRYRVAKIHPASLFRSFDIHFIINL
jgi:hypothetical protein